MKFRVNWDSMHLEATGALPRRATDEVLVTLSLEKWHTLSCVDYENEESGEVIDDRGVRTCPLCVKYYENHCMGCPIKEYTGQPSCEGTPYWEYQAAAAAGNPKAAKAAAHREEEFLEVVLRSLWEEC